MPNYQSSFWPIRSVLYLLVLIYIGSTCPLQAQSLLDAIPESEKVPEPNRPYVIYKAPKLISCHTTEVIQKGALDYRISHRFGDMASKGTGYHTLFGFDQAEDILLAFDYGISDNWGIGIGRSKGNGPLRELWFGETKYKLKSQSASSKFAATFVGNVAFSSMEVDPFNAELRLNDNASHTFSYLSQVVIAHRANNLITLSAAPTFIWRNYVADNDANGLVFLPITARVSVSNRSSIVLEYAPMLGATGANYRGSGPVFYSNSSKASTRYFTPIHLGYEIETGGHVFMLNITNSPSMLENDFLAYNARDISKGQFRLGFTILRFFQLHK